eukprot:3012759-Rhodomonas_salina.1
MRQHSSRSRLQFRPQRKTMTATSHTSPDRTSATHDSDLLEWTLVLDRAGVRWTGRALLLGDTICTVMLHLDERLPVYNTAAVRDALPSLDHSLLPALCAAVGTPLTSTVFLCKGFRHTRALQTTIQFNLSLGSLVLPSTTIKAGGTCTDFGWTGLQAIIPSPLLVLPEQRVLASLVVSIDSLSVTHFLPSPLHSTLFFLASFLSAAPPPPSPPAPTRWCLPSTVLP